MMTSRPDPRDDLRIPPPVMDVAYDVRPTDPPGTVVIHDCAGRTVEMLARHEALLCSVSLPTAEWRALAEACRSAAAAAELAHDRSDEFADYERQCFWETWAARLEQVLGAPVTATAAPPSPAPPPPGTAGTPAPGHRAP